MIEHLFQVLPQGLTPDHEDFQNYIDDIIKEYRDIHSTMTGEIAEVSVTVVEPDNDSGIYSLKIDIKY